MNADAASASRRVRRIYGVFARDAVVFASQSEMWREGGREGGRGIVDFDATLAIVFAEWSGCFTPEAVTLWTKALWDHVDGAVECLHGR